MRVGFAATLFLFAKVLAAGVFSPATPLTHVRYASNGIPARASVASNGHGFVAAWQTDRDVRVARIDGRESNVGVPIEPWGWSAPSIVAAGDHYVVAANHGQDLEAVIVDESGHPAGAAIPIEADGFAPRIAASVNRIGIAYMHTVAGRYRLVLALLSPSGTVLAKNINIPVEVLLNSRSPYDIAATATGFAVSVVSTSGIVVVILDADGNFLALTALQTRQLTGRSESADRAVVAADGRAFVVLWTASDGTLCATSLSPSGSVLRTTKLASTRQTSGSAVIGQPSIAFDGAQYVCGYVDGEPGGSDVIGKAYVTRIEPLLLMTPLPQLLQTDSYVLSVAIACGRGTSLVLWADDGKSWFYSAYIVGAGSLHAAMVDDEGIGPPFALATAAAEQLTPAAASNGAETLVAWNERTADTNSILAGIYNGAGNWRELGQFVSRQYTAAPLVVASGSAFLVVWPGGAVRVTADGIRFDTTPIVTPSSFEPTSALWDGSRFVIAGNGSEGLEVLTIDLSGVVGPLRVVRAAAYERVFDPMLAWNGTSFLMSYIWQEPIGINNFFPREEVHVSVLTSTFESRTDARISPLISSVSSAPLAWNGNEFLAVFRVENKLNATRISPDGVSLGTVLIRQTEAESPGRASIITDGSDFVVSWRGNETHERTTPLYDFLYYPASPMTNHQIVTHSDGSMSEIAVIDSAGMTGDLVLVNAVGRQLLISSRADNESPYYGASRVTIQTIDVAATGFAPNLTYAFEGPVATLRWTPVANATEYRIEYRSGTDTWRELDLTRIFLPSLSVRIQSTTTKFEFRVRGWSGSGTFPYSNPVILVLPRRHAA